ncbi:MAG TPA: cytochrome P450 [Propionibacteriaceae bacterium]|nr:cytochrome P450 [Propionibacteriaceae bacterium]
MAAPAETSRGIATASPLAPMPPGHWLLGHLKERRRDPLRLFSSSQRLLGDVVRYRMGYIYVEQFTHPDQVRHVLVDAKDIYVKGTIWDKVKPLVGNGLVTADGQDWMRQRRLAQPVFRHARLEPICMIMTNAIADVLEGWTAQGQNGKTIALFSELRKLTLTVVIRALFGTELAQRLPTVAGSFVGALEVINRRIISPTPYLPWLYRVPTRDNLAFRRAVRHLNTVVEEIIQHRERAGQPESTDLLDLIMTAQLAEESQITPRLLRDEIMTLLLAGFETSATTMTWAICLLERHPETWARMVTEVDLALRGRTPDFSDLAALPYTRAVIEETLRLRPAKWAIPRMASRTDEVRGFRVPRGDIIILVPYVTHRHPAFWVDPDHFEPARFLPANRSDIDRWAYFPFGAGQRKCLGIDFALMEGQLALAMIAQRFQLHSPDQQDVRPDPYVTLRPTGEVPMLVTAR